MNFIPAGAELDSDDEDGELPAFIAEQIGHHGFNVNNVQNLFDGLDLVDYEFDIDADDFFDDDDEDWYDEYYDSDFEFRSDDEDEETHRKIITGIFNTKQYAFVSRANNRDLSSLLRSLRLELFEGNITLHTTTV